MCPHGFALLQFLLNYCLGKPQQYCFQPHQNFVNMITHELLHLTWWNFAWMCLTTSRTVLNVKGQGQVDFFVCVSCVHDTAWTSWPRLSKCYLLGGTRGQYLALSKAWWSCLYCFVLTNCWVLFCRIMNSQFHSSEPDPDAIKMFAGQIPRYMDENDLQKLFEEFGPVYQINVLRDKVTNQSKGEMLFFSEMCFIIC